MNFGILFLLIISILIGIYIDIFRRQKTNLFDSTQCPFCYGTNLCKDVVRITLQYNTFTSIFNNLLSVKNIFFAEFDRKAVVLKKLGHDSELKQITKSQTIDEEFLLNYLDDGSSSKGLKTCNRNVSKIFIKNMKGFELEEIWTILQVNAEPLILTILQKGWPVPEFYGSCGFVIVEEFKGVSLNYFEHYSWEVRAFLALQLLEAAIAFTQNHEHFKIYLTDISPDNIVIDDNFKVTFIDLENVILQEKTISDNHTIHYSRFFPEEEFIYSEEEICSNSLSDHNIYSVCRVSLTVIKKCFFKYLF